LPDDTPLHEALSRTIERAGPISIAAFMAQANAHYYATRDPLGAPNGARGGDFVTAPEVSQMFGEMIGLWCADLAMRAAESDDFAYVELGPGRGTLAVDAMRSMAQFGLAPDIHLVETSPVLKRAQAERLPAARFHETIATLPDDRPLIIVANEFFDALPVAQFISTAAGWRERVVGRHKDRLIAMPGADPADEAVPETLRRQPPGMIVEHCPDAVAIAADLATRIAAQGGALLVIDYGYQGPKVGDTLQSVRRHKIADPFDDPGEQDLTAHVDFAALAAPANDRGLRIAGPVEQGKFLHTLGLGHRAEALRRTNPARDTEIITQYHRLTDPYEMGSLFKAMALTAPDWPTPEGFG
jgi:SAM-dependent MidA family methyltransferase